mmetsp:Transcript_20600/g.64862  ORF Transcript_20600/g.64862 Transcript_20600/m.64862 type:complete len:208 (+) Transcript_20600:171-794(+)
MVLRPQPRAPALGEGSCSMRSTARASSCWGEAAAALRRKASRRAACLASSSCTARRCSRRSCRSASEDRPMSQEPYITSRRSSVAAGASEAPSMSSQSAMSEPKGARNNKYASATPSTAINSLSRTLKTARAARKRTLGPSCRKQSRILCDCSAGRVLTKRQRNQFIAMGSSSMALSTRWAWRAGRYFATRESRSLRSALRPLMVEV